jgi:hypothetical protein
LIHDRSCVAVARVFSVLGAWLLTLSWLWVAFFYPQSWLPEVSFEDPRLYLAILIGFLHLPYGGLLMGLWVRGAVRLPFVISVFLAPLVYLVGSPYDPPLAYVVFIGPSVVILVAGLVELCWPFRSRRGFWLSLPEKP